MHIDKICYKWVGNIALFSYRYAAKSSDKLTV